MTNLFADGTVVTPEKSRTEIERTVRRYGATEFGFGEKPDSAFVGFTIGARRIKFTIKRPTEREIRDAQKLWIEPRRIPTKIDAEWRRRWRSLTLAIKAKLEIAATGIVPFEEEFLGSTVFDNGETVYEVMRGQLESVYERTAPLLLTAGR